MSRQQSSTRGVIVYTFDLDTGFTTLISASGTQRDLCAELS